MKLYSKLLLSLGFLGLSLSPASADVLKMTGSDHRFGLEFRTDYVSNSAELDGDAEDADFNDDSKKSAFEIQRARLNVRGNINDLTSYRIRLNLRASSDGAGKTDGTGSFLNRAFLNRKLTDTITLQVGKYGMTRMAIEDWQDGADQYYYSELGNVVPSSDITGANLQVALMGTLYLQIGNNPFNEKNQNSYQTGIAWAGNLMDGMLEPILSYTMISHTEQKAKDSKGVETKTDSYSETLWGAGAQVNIKMGGDSKIQIQAELDGYTVPEYDKGSTTMPEWTMNTWITELRYVTKHFSPFLKMSGDKKKVESIGKVDEMEEDWSKYAVGVEFSPDGNAKKSYRVHGVYTSNTFMPDDNAKDADGSSKEDETYSKVIVGVTAYFN